MSIELALWTRRRDLRLRPRLPVVEGVPAPVVDTGVVACVAATACSSGVRSFEAAAAEVTFTACGTRVAVFFGGDALRARGEPCFGNDDDDAGVAAAAVVVVSVVALWWWRWCERGGSCLLNNDRTTRKYSVMYTELRRPSIAPPQPRTCSERVYTV